jgi:hypothetical protein
LVSALYEIFLKATKAHNLGAYILVVAKKEVTPLGRRFFLLPFFDETVNIKDTKAIFR